MVKRASKMDTRVFLIGYLNIYVFSYYCQVPLKQVRFALILRLSVVDQIFYFAEAARHTKRMLSTRGIQ